MDVKLESFKGDLVTIIIINYEKMPIGFYRVVTI